MKRTIVSTVLIAGLLAGAAFSEDVKPKPIEVPFELLRSRHMAIQVMINGKGPYRFVFDTGAPINIVSKKVGEETGMSKSKPKARNNMMMAGGQAVIETLEVGDLKAKNLAAMVIDHPTVVAMSNVLGPIEGIIGFPLFAQHATTVDYQTSKLTFVPNGYKPKDLLQQLTASLLTRSAGSAKAVVIGSKGIWGVTFSKPDGDEKAGVVLDVLAGSAADAAGLKTGDRLLTVDGRWTDQPADVLNSTKNIAVGKFSEWEVQRGETRRIVKLSPRTGL